MAATIRLFCAGAVKSAVTDLMKTVEQDTGTRFAYFFGTVGALLARMRAGEVADIVILTRPALEQLVGQGKVLMDTLTDLPPSLQHVTTYSAGIVAHGAAFHEARKCLTYLTSPSAQEKFRALGFEHV